MKDGGNSPKPKRNHPRRSRPRSHDQTDPERERAPLDVIIDSRSELFRVRESELRFGQIFGFVGQRRLGLGVQSFLHARNTRAGGGTCLYSQSPLSIPLYHMAAEVRKIRVAFPFVGEPIRRLSQGAQRRVSQSGEAHSYTMTALARVQRSVSSVNARTRKSAWKQLGGTD